MAIRFYFPLDTAAPVTPPAAGAEWEHNNGVSRYTVAATPGSSTLTTVAYTPDGGDDILDKDALHRQYVSDPLEAQTLSGNIKGQFQCIEDDARNNLFLTLKVLVISNDGTTVRNTLLSITRDTTNECANTLINRNFPSTALGSYACAQGDRVCFEIGLGGLPTASGGTQGHNGSIRWGETASSGDLPEDDTQTGLTYRPWIEISNTWTFYTAPAVLRNLTLLGVGL